MSLESPGKKGKESLPEKKPVYVFRQNFFNSVEASYKARIF